MLCGLWGGHAGRDNCLLCLGHEHALVSRGNPQSCMDVSEGPRQKIGRMVAASQGRREYLGAWQAPLPPLQKLDVETVFSSDDNDLSCGQHTVSEVTRGELPHRLEEVINRASRALGVSLPENPGATSSRFGEGMEVCPASTQVPLLPDFKELLCQQFQSPAATHRWWQVAVFPTCMTETRLLVGHFPQWTEPSLH